MTYPSPPNNHVPSNGTSSVHPSTVSSHASEVGRNWVWQKDVSGAVLVCGICGKLYVPGTDENIP